MSQDKIVVKSEEAASAINKKEILSAADNGDSIEEDNYGLKLTLDNSLSKYANDPFFIEHARQVDKKFAKSKSDS